MRVGRGVRVASKCHLKGALKLPSKELEAEESQGEGGEGWMPWRPTVTFAPRTAARHHKDWKICLADSNHQWGCGWFVANDFWWARPCRWILTVPSPPPSTRPSRHRR